jgi:hypothetical protein
MKMLETINQHKQRKYVLVVNGLYCLLLFLSAGLTIIFLTYIFSYDSNSK